jgi:hypothetical protein
LEKDAAIEEWMAQNIPMRKKYILSRLASQNSSSTEAINRETDPYPEEINRSPSPNSEEKSTEAKSLQKTFIEKY